MTSPIRQLASASVLLLLASGHLTAQEYTFRALGLPNSTQDRALAVNDSGTVAGTSRFADGTTHAFVQTGAAVVDLFPTAYFASPSASQSPRLAINAAGHVIGAVRQANDDCNQGFLYFAGVARVLSLGGCSLVVALNSQGQVIGRGNTTDGRSMAFVYTPNGAGGSYVILDLGGSYSYPTAINDAGQAAGYAQLPSGRYRAIRFTPGVGTVDLGTLGGTDSYAYAINTAGEVGGSSIDSAGVQRMFKYSDGVMSGESTTGTQYSSGNHIDDNGWVIGQRTGSSGYTHLVRFDGTVLQDLATSLPSNAYAYPSMINRSGTIGGYSYYQTGTYCYWYYDYYYGYYYYNCYATYSNAPIVWHAGTLYNRPYSNGGSVTSVGANGHATGYDYATGDYRGLVFSPTTNSFLSFGLGSSSYAYHVNSTGLAVGWATSGSQVAVRRTAAGTDNLNSLVAVPAGSVLREATVVSDTGYIIGRHEKSGGCNTVCAYLLTPVPDDALAPSTTASAEPLPNGAGWANQDVTVTLTAVDETDGSGVKEVVYSATGAGAFAETVVSGATATLVISAEGTTTITYFALDNAGNEEAPQTLVVLVDKTAPAFTCASADGAWHGANVTLACTAADPVSGLVNASDAAFNLTTSIAPDTETANASTDSRTVCDLAGNCAAAGPIAGNKIDRKAPAITLTSPTATSYALAQSVAAAFACADTGSGIGSCSAPAANGADIDTATAGAKTFTVTATDAVGNTATASVSYTVLKGTPSITWAAPAPIVYGTPLGATQLNASSSVDGTFVYTPAAGVVLAAGTHALSVTFTPDDTANYDPVVTPNSITVTPAALTITADSLSKPYGAALPTFTASTSGFVNSDTLASLTGGLTFDTTATAGSPVATYPITPGGVSSANYAITFVPGTLSITPVALIVTASDASRPYGAANPAFTATYSGFVNSDDSGDLGGVLGFTTVATPASAVGAYPVTPGGLTAVNYAIQFAAGTLTVTPASLVVTANDAAKLYGAPLPVFTASYGGLVNGDSSAVLAGTLTFTTAASDASPVGAYPVTPGGVSAVNYQITFAAGTLTVNAAALTVTANNATKVYGAPLPTFDASVGGLVNGDTEAALTGTLDFTTTATPDSPVGSYAVTPGGLTAANYTLTFLDGTLDVTPAALTVTMSSTSKVYGAPLPTFAVSYSGLTAGDGAGDLGGGLTFSTGAAEGSPVGVYPVSPSGLSSPNYTIAFVDGTLTVTPAPLVVTADAATKAYGAPMPGFSASYAGLVNGDTPAALAGTLDFVTAALPSSPVGDYPVTPGGLSSGNYTVTFAAGTLTVTRAALTITANDATKVYGAANPAFSAAIAGFVNLDDASDLGGTLAYSTAANASSGVGAYAVTPSGLTSPNYTLTYVAGTLTVTPAALTVTAAPATKVYGAAMPSFTASYGGFVNGDDAGDLTGTVGFSTAATTGSGVGSYPVTPAGLTSTNYNIAFVDGTLTVTPATLVITADNQSMVLNGTMPAFTAAYAGFVNGDAPASLTVAPTLATAATGGAAGLFPIVPSGAVGANYAISYANGTLTVGYLAAGNCLAGAGRVILQPINVDGTSVFKKGSTVPAKFRVCDASGVAVSAAGTITDFRLIQTQAGTIASVNEPVESTTPFSEFRWDAAGQHWIFNMSTRGQSANVTYTYRVSLADGTWMDFRFGLK